MRYIALLLTLLSIQSTPAIEVQLATPVTLTVVVDKLDLYEELDGVAIGTDRQHLTRYAYAKPILVDTNGVTIAGQVRLDISVVQATQDIAAAEGTGKTYDALTRAKQAQFSRARAMARIRPALVSAKERVEKPTP